MFKSAATFAAVGLVGLLVLRVAFGFVFRAVGLTFGLAFFLLKLLLGVGLVYWLVSVVSPATARKLRQAVWGE
jgi:hypothetical protein